MLKKKFTILDHELVPKHILLSKEERRQLLEQLKIRPEQLPWIRASDPVAKLIGAKPGDIVKIIRKSPTAGETVAYRFVVP
ncbi:MAG: DNA-directed RNA polymerase subunit H [Candidatus Verstraetearchaeota archaeon]|jgi:DNA-directed RNA polymerase subunit H|nr:DNA-directed RNA polymerase subunit H [Candidatus Verstraetearchaeota archaeon]